MKTFYLLKLQYGANQVMNEVKYENEGQAVTFYQRLYPELKLNNNGYAQPETNSGISYCIARKFGE